MVVTIDIEKKHIVNKTAARMRQLRTAKKYSQEELALQAGINPAYLGHIERGLKCPTIDTVNKLAIALDISLSEFFDFEDTSDRNDLALNKIIASIKNIPEGKVQNIAQIVDDIIKLLESEAP